MFTLNRLKIEHKSHILYDCTITNKDFSNRTESLCSLVIGKNGSGKSYLLAQTSEFFRYLREFQTTDRPQKNYRYQNVQIEYTVDNKVYEIQYNNRQVKAWKNREAIDIKSVIFPERILALSFMVNDKFTYGNERDDFYCYLGVRSSSNATYTSSLQKKIFTSVLSCINDEQRYEQLLRVLKFIGLKPCIRLTFNCSRKTLFTRKIEHRIVSQKIEQYIANRNKLQKLTANTDKQVDDLVDFINKKKHGGKLKGTSLTYDIDFNNAQLFLQKADYLDTLVEIGYLAPQKIEFYKQDSFAFEFASSGEKHLLFTMLNLISRVKKNSLILIDEPEISMHPAWQMKYINLIKT